MTETISNLWQMSPWLVFLVASLSTVICSQNTTLKNIATVVLIISIIMLII